MTSDDEATDPLSSLKTDLAGKIGGGVMLTETTAGAWGDGKGVSPNTDWIQIEIGWLDQPIQGKPFLIREAAHTTVLSACGIPPSAGVRS